MYRKGQSLLRKIKHSTSIPWQRTIGGSGGKSLDKVMTEFEDELKSVALAFNTNMGLSSTPSCLASTMKFTPEAESFSVYLPVASVVGLFTGGFNTLVNYVIRDANTYQIPIRNNSSGAFCVKFISVYIVQRIWNPFNKSESFQRVPSGRITGNISTMKFAIHNLYDDVAGGFNYFWNIEDAKSGRLLADDLMSHLVMTPRTNIYPFVNGSQDQGTFEGTMLDQGSPWLDGDFFELEVPWIIERDGQVNFHFRPITPLLQFDSSVAGGLATTNNNLGDDREAGIRRQDGYIYIELHGHKLHSDQDLTNMGALTTDDSE